MTKYEEKIKQGAISIISGTITITKSQLLRNLDEVLAEEKKETKNRVREIDKLDTEILSYGKQIETWKDKVTILELENIDLKAKIKELEEQNSKLVEHIKNLQQPVRFNELPEDK